MAPMLGRPSFRIVKRACRASPGARRLVVAQSTSNELAQLQLLQQQALQPRTLSTASSMPLGASQTASSASKHVLMLSSTTSVAASTDAVVPTAFARLVVGATLALGTVYALISSTPASSSTDAVFPPRAEATATDIDNTVSGAASTTAATATTTATPAFPALPILRTPEQFDAFVIASNRAGYLAVVLFHAPWCAASQRMEKELQRLSHMVSGRRVVFARVDCSIKQGIQPGQKLGQSQSFGFRLQRCDLTQLHRIHKTPTVRMYYHNACVDEIIGFRPVDFRQATSDLAFKFNL